MAAAVSRKSLAYIEPHQLLLARVVHCRKAKVICLQKRYPASVSLALLVAEASLRIAIVHECSWRDSSIRPFYLDRCIVHWTTADQETPSHLPKMGITLSKGVLLPITRKWWTHSTVFGLHNNSSLSSNTLPWSRLLRLLAFVTWFLKGLWVCLWISIHRYIHWHSIIYFVSSGSTGCCSSEWKKYLRKSAGTILLL